MDMGISIDRRYGGIPLGPARSIFHRSIFIQAFLFALHRSTMNQVTLVVLIKFDELRLLYTYFVLDRLGWLVGIVGIRERQQGE
jgi:hypothetical protein